MKIFLIGFTLGIFSAGHCLGMCGPIAFFFGTHQCRSSAGSFEKIRLFLSLGVGKALTYAWIGLIFGAAGHLLTQWSEWLGFSRALPYLTGALFIFSGLAMAGFLPKFEIVLHGLEQSLRRLFSSFRSTQTPGSWFAMGMIWGLLPCPMVLAPALGAAVSGSSGGWEGALKGFFMMFGFGLGTIPALYSGALAADWLNKIRIWSPRIVGFSLISFGVACLFFSSAMTAHGLSGCRH